MATVVEAFRTARLVVALALDGFLAFVVPTPLMMWAMTLGPLVCRPPADDRGSWCATWYLLGFLVVVPVVSMLVASVYVGVSVWRGRSPMMFLARTYGSRRRGRARMPVAVAAALGSVVVAFVVVFGLYGYVTSVLENPTVVPESTD